MVEDRNTAGSTLGAACDQHVRSDIQPGLQERAGQAGPGKATHRRLHHTPRRVHVCNSIYLHVYTLDISWRLSLPYSFFSTSKEDIKQEKHLLKQQANLYSWILSFKWTFKGSIFNYRWFHEVQDWSLPVWSLQQGWF